MSERTVFAPVETLVPTTEHTIHGYNNAGAFQTYEVFDVTGESPEMKAASAFREEQKRLFLEGEIVNPVLNNCPKFTLERGRRRNLYAQTLATVYTRRLMFADGREGTLEDELFEDMLDLRLREVNFVETAAIVAEGNIAPEERERLADILKRGARECYGMPDRDDALTLIGTRLEKAEKIALEPEHPARQTARELLDMVALPEYEQQEPPQLSPETAQYYREIIRGECEEAVEYAFATIGKKDIYTPEEMRVSFDRYLEYRNIAQEGWHSVVIPNRASCAAKMATLAIEIGENRDPAQLKYGPVLESELHEGEIHAGRQARGKKLGSGLAEFGLRDYVFFEEAFADIWAALYSGQPKRKGEPYVMGIALADGYDGLERDFRDNYETLWRLGFVNTYTAKKPVAEQMERSQKRAYTSLVRLWRGMPTDVPGCVGPKDRAYDNTKVLRYLQPDGGRLSKADFLRLIQAKYDPTNPKQDAYIRSLAA